MATAEELGIRTRVLGATRAISMLKYPSGTYWFLHKAGDIYNVTCQTCLRHNIPSDSNGLYCAGCIGFTCTKCLQLKDGKYYCPECTDDG